jgi:beta-glucosidase
VQHWITLNEPWCIAWLGHQTGEHAPGFEEDTPTKALAAAHHALLAHGTAMTRLRALVPSGQHGITLNVTQIDAATSKPADLAAAARYDGFYNRWFFDAVFRGHYPADKLDEWAAYLPEIAPSDMAQIAAPVDFLGLNYYTRAIIAADPDDPDNREIGILQPDVPRTTMGWEIYPEGLYAWLMRIHHEYAPRAIYVTENGAAFADTLDADDRVRDSARIAYLQAHFEAAQRALHDGAPLKGYFVWSLLDNFEWAHGYSQRFGITYLDYATQRRIVKDSGRYFAQVAGGSR